MSVRSWPVGVHLHAVPAGVGRHQGHDAGIDRGDIALRMDADEIALGRAIVAGIDGIEGAALADPRLAGRRDPPRLQLARRVPADPCSPWTAAFAYSRTSAGSGESLVAAAPAHVLRHGERRRKRPVDARSRDRPAVTAPMRRTSSVSRAAPSPMLCGKITAPCYVAVTVYCVDAEQHRDRDVARARRQCGRVETARELEPLLRCCTIVAIRTAIAAGENRAERITREIFRHNRADVGLDDLADFVLEVMPASSLSMRASVSGSMRPRLCACGHSSRMHRRRRMLPRQFAADPMIAQQAHATPIAANSLLRARRVAKAEARRPGVAPNFAGSRGIGRMQPARPCEGQSTTEIESGSTLRIADQYVRDAAAASVPGSHAATNASLASSSGRTQSGRPEEIRSPLDAGMLQPCSCSRGSPHVVERKLDIAVRLGVRFLAVDDHRNVRPILAGEIRTVNHSPAARLDRSLHRGLHRLRRPEIRVAGVVPLPGHRPAATLHRNTVGARPGHQHASRARGSAGRRRS